MTGVQPRSPTWGCLKALRILFKPRGWRTCSHLERPIRVKLGGLGVPTHLTSSRPPPLYVRTPCTPASKLDQNSGAAPGDLPNGLPFKTVHGKAPNLNLVSAVRSLRALPASNHILNLFDLPKPPNTRDPQVRNLHPARFRCARACCFQSDSFWNYPDCP